MKLIKNLNLYKIYQIRTNSRIPKPKIKFDQTLTRKYDYSINFFFATIQRNINSLQRKMWISMIGLEINEISKRQENLIKPRMKSFDPS